MTSQQSPEFESERDRIINIILNVARSIDALVIVGNGDLSRRIAAFNDGVSTLLLEGAMGMAAAVAVGYSRYCRRPLIVIEGDGNRVLGAPSAEWLQTQSCHACHVVFVNGIFASSGGQRVPVDLASRDAGALHFHGSSEKLSDAIDEWVTQGGTRRLLIYENSSHLELRTRPTGSLRGVTARTKQESVRWLKL